MKVTLPFVFKNTLGLDITNGADLPTDLQYTKERKPDLLRRIKTENGKEVLLHVEYQTTNDKLMACRMAEYNVMLRRSYNVHTTQPIKQYVLFFGKRKARMPLAIKAPELKYSYQVIQISDIDYELFLNSDNPEDQILAILGNLKGNKPLHILSQIMTKLHTVARGELANNKYINQLHLLSQLRNLEDDFKYITTMGNFASFFKIEKDPFYKEGKLEGKLEKALEVAKKMRSKGKSEEEIAEITELSIADIRNLSIG